MAEYRRNRRPVQSAEYVYGNTVRKPERIERPERPERQPRRSARRSAIIRRNQERAVQMDFPFVLMLTAAAICMLCICVGYLQLQSSNTARLRNIETLEKQLEDLRADNDALETSINTSVDLDYVYKVATEELGMVYANRNQVRLYNKTESGYIRQYEDIPEW